MWDSMECKTPLFGSLHCENASMSDNPHDCDAILLESIDIVDIPNIKLLKKKRLRSLIRI